VTRSATPRVVAIVQARMGSTRLPGKVLLPIAGRPMVLRVLERLGRADRIDGIVVACSTSCADDPLAAAVEGSGAGVFRGDERDVLARYVGAAREAGAEVVVRITADCPLLDPGVVDEVVGALLASRGSADYASNVLSRTYPRGLDVEALFLDALLRADRFAATDAEREHVTVAIRNGPPGRFATLGVAADVDDSDLRWTVDSADDMEYVRRLYAAAGLAERHLAYREVVALCRRDPSLRREDEAGRTWDPVGWSGSH
jgi:spore coat polysaccharide biosynthesis protein SpsF (cytidylyltransferase family)